MKQKGKVISIFIIIIFIIVTFTVNYSKKIKASSEIDVLTKNSIFDIIYNVDSIIINCISTDGDKHLSKTNKLDTTVIYIINNIEKFKDYIITCEYDGSEIRCFGKIGLDKFREIYLGLFDSMDYNIEEYKYYKEGYVELYFEPCNYPMWDKKEVMSFTFKDNKYNLIIKYIRNLNDIQNNIYIKYELDCNLKIQNVSILSSIVK